MNRELLSKSYFDEKVFVIRAAKPGLFDIQVNESRCSQFKKTGKLCDLCFNDALLEKIQEFSSLQRLDFVNYQINKYNDPLDWIKRFRAFIYDNQDNFETSNYNAYRELLEISDQGIQQLSNKNKLKEESVPKEFNTLSFINEKRITDLKSIETDKHDLSRLIRLCEELNTNYKNGSYISVILLTRSLIDHIPPIFGQKSFSEVYGNYGTQSFKEHMTHLDKSMRKIADSYLHTHIRKKETLPTINQVSFVQDIDVLISEITRHLSEPDN